MKTYCYYCMKEITGAACDCEKSMANRVIEADLPAGTVLNERYLIGHPLGAGGFGTTYIARDLTLDLKVAIKAYHEHRATYREKLIAEAKKMALFENEAHVVRVRDYFDDGSTAYLVMEYLEGRTLLDLINEKGKLTLEETRDIISPIIDVLAKIHSQGMVHCDISPDNIMITDQGVKLLDFGSAHVQTADEKTMTVSLKSGYTPPEQYQGLVIPAIDIYSLSATIYKCLTGVKPIDSLERLFLNDETIETPSVYGCYLSQEKTDVLMKGLALDHHERLSDITALKTLFAPEVVQEAGPKKKRHIRKLPVLLAVLVIAVALFGLRFVGEDRSFYKESTNLIQVNDMILTGKQIRTLARRRKSETLSFYGCTFTKDALDHIERLDRTKTLLLHHCLFEGSLNGLAGMQKLTRVSLATNTILDGSSLVTTDCPQITSLTCRDINKEGGFKGSEFLSHFPQMQTLDLTDAFGITDLSFLTKMPMLTSLSLGSADFDDARAKKPCAFDAAQGKHIASCLALRSLTMNYTGIGDISFASSLRALTSVSLIGNYLTSVKALSSSPALNRVTLSHNKLTSLSGLENMSGLYYVAADHNALVDLTALKSPKLSQLILNHNNVSDLSPLSKLSSLSTLDLGFNKVSSLEACQTMYGLTNLSIQHNSVTSLADLVNCTNLKRINANHNQITEIQVFAQNDFSELKALDLNNNRLTDLSPLSSYTKIEVIQIENNALTTLAGLKNSQPKYLLAAYNKLTDISMIDVQRIKYLDLGHNKLTDVANLKNLMSDDLVLLLESNNITDLDCLSYKKCKGLVFYDNPLTSSDFLGKMTKRSNYVYLPYHEGFDFNDIADASFSAVKIVDVPGNRQAALQDEISDTFRTATFKIVTKQSADQDLKSYREALIKECEKYGL